MGANGLTLIPTHWIRGAAGSNNPRDDKSRSGGRFLGLQYIFNGNLAPLETTEITGAQNNAHGGVARYGASFVNDEFSRCESFAANSNVRLKYHCWIHAAHVRRNASHVFVIYMQMPVEESNL